MATDRPIGAFSEQEEKNLPENTTVYFCPVCWYAFPTPEVRDKHNHAGYELLKGVK